MDHGRRRMRSRDLIGPLLFILSAIQDSHLTDAYDLTRRIVDFNASSELDSHHHPCHLNRAEVPKPEDLLGCGNSSLFEIWRPKARLIGSRGWMNDPMGIYQTWENPVTIAPSQLYDIRGVFDGAIIKDGWNGHPTIFYTSAFTGPLGHKTIPPEKEGAETQSMAYTEDDGQTWTKLNFGANGNPVIYHWPEQHLTGFRDPFVFESADFLAHYSKSENSSSSLEKGQSPTGTKFLTLSGGIRADLDALNAGPRLFLYRQTYAHSLLEWTYLGPLIALPPVDAQSSPWRGATGVNFECGALVKIDEGVPGSHELDIFIGGTEGARNQTHMDDWAIWAVLEYDYNRPDGQIKAELAFSGVIDWGRAYAFVSFPTEDRRQILVGWAYEDDEQNTLTYQRGYQGAFTLFREMFVKVISHVPAGIPELEEKEPNWSVRSEIDGTRSIITLGQRILPEILSSYRKQSKVSRPLSRSLETGQTKTGPKVVPFETQPSDRFYAVTAQLDFQGANGSSVIDRSEMARGGFRVLASEKEWTDIYYDPSTESLVVSRLHSSVIPAYGNSSEAGKLRLWPIRDPLSKTTSLESLNLTIVVDNSIIEVYANDQTVVTTRAYPWLKHSIGVGFFVEPSSPHASAGTVKFSNVELWDGLLNAWPNRPRNTALMGTFSHNITSSLYDVWTDI